MRADQHHPSSIFFLRRISQKSRNQTGSNQPFPLSVFRFFLFEHQIMADSSASAASASGAPSSSGPSQVSIEKATEYITSANIREFTAAIKSGRLNPNLTDPDTQNSLLHLAASKRDRMDFVLLLVRHGADVNAINA